MPKAEVGSTKWQANKLKSKGLQRLRWYCQLCEKQCRDENGFKMHTQSESHMHKALAVGDNFKQVQQQYTDEFVRDFIQLLKTGHGEKAVHINRFYQEYIANKTHIHMNATRFSSLSEFAKYLGREGICRVEEKEDDGGGGGGIFISWIDNSPEALRRREALRRKDAMDKGDEAHEQMLMKEQIRRAQKEAEARGARDGSEASGKKELVRAEGEKVRLAFGTRPVTSKDESRTAKSETAAASTAGGNEQPPSASPATNLVYAPRPDTVDETTTKATATPAPAGEAKLTAATFKFGAKPHIKNVFKSNALASGAKKKVMKEQPKKMSEAERIMREEMERKRPGPGGSGSASGSESRSKRPRF